MPWNLRSRLAGCGAILLSLMVLPTALGRSAPALPSSLTAVSQNAPSPANEEVTMLEAGKPVTRVLTATETHRYQIRLQSGECAVIRIEQRGIDLTVQFLGSANGVEAEVEGEIGAHAAEQLELVADHDGAYQVMIKPKSKLAGGSYEIRMVDVHAATAKDRSRYEVRQLRTQIHALLEAGKTQEALPKAEQALTLTREGPGADEIAEALLMRDLADIAYTKGKFEEARAGHERALQVLSTRLGAENPQAIYEASRLGSAYYALGDLSRADQLYAEALEKAEKAAGKDDPLLVVPLKSLAILHSDRGDIAKAEGEDQRALAILEKSGLTDQATYGELLNNLGVLYNHEPEFDKAEVYFERALSFQEKKWGKDSPSLSRVLNNLGIVARHRGDFAAAEKYYLRALALKEKYVGPDHPEYAAVLINLANVYASEGDYKKALDTDLRAVNIFNQAGGVENSPPIVLLANVAKFHAAVGDWESANKAQAELDSALESELALNLAIGSEREKLAYLDSVAQRTERTISLNLQLEPDSQQAAALAATVLLQRKGRALDAMADTFSALRKHSDPHDQALLDQLQDTTSQFARISLQGPGKLSAAEYHQKLQSLQEKKEALENTISHQNDEFRSQAQAPTLEAVQAAIPLDSALLEFVAYRPFNPKSLSDAKQYGEERYAVYVLHHDSAKAIDLGDAKAMDALVANFRAALRDPSRNDVRQMAEALARKVLQPIQSLITNDKRLLVSPDGQLDLIPFEALVDAQGQYLVERFAITYLTTGRDLLRMQVPRPSRSEPVVVADPMFGEPKGALLANAAGPRAKSANARSARRSVTTGADFASLYFAELKGTRVEAESIHALFPEARVLTGERASEAALEQLDGPQILHIATHGFFLQDSGKGSNPHPNGNGALTKPTADVVNPLLRSGLALSGANLFRDDKGGGILTALQAANLHLWGTKLVTLSACDTGIGEVRNGEGVYGLRRSFFLAGAETLVMSLWPVSDYVTREMMTSYYKGLKHGLGRGDALREAQLAMLKRKDRQHPFYWASFIQSGEWANLDGKR